MAHEPFGRVLAGDPTSVRDAWRRWDRQAVDQEMDVEEVIGNVGGLLLHTAGLLFGGGGHQGQVHAGFQAGNADLNDVLGMFNGMGMNVDITRRGPRGP